MGASRAAYDPSVGLGRRHFPIRMGRRLRRQGELEDRALAVRFEQGDVAAMGAHEVAGAAEFDKKSPPTDANKTDPARLAERAA